MNCWFDEKPPHHLVRWLFVEVANHQNSFLLNSHGSGFSLNLVKSGSFIKYLYACSMNKPPLNLAIKGAFYQAVQLIEY